MELIEVIKEMKVILEYFKKNNNLISERMLRSWLQSIEQIDSYKNQEVKLLQILLKAKSVVNHWNEFGYEYGFEESIDSLERQIKRYEESSIQLIGGEKNV